MRSLLRSGRSPWCRSAQDTRAAVRAFVVGASPELRRLGSLAGYQQAAGRRQLGPAGMPGAG
jgi:hypothetical protein